MSCCLISIPILNFLYPDWADRAIYYVPWTTLTSLLNLVSAVTNVIVIRFAKSKWQVVVNGGYLVIYLISSFILLYFWGLVGFCIGNLIAAISKNLLILFVTKFAINFNDNN